MNYDNIMNMNKLKDLLQNARSAQEKIEKAKKEVSVMQVDGESGGGLITLSLVGGRQIKNLQIDSSLMNDKDMLQDLIAAAFADALSKWETALEEKMRSSLSILGD